MIGMSEFEREGLHLRNLSSCVLGTEGISGTGMCAFSVIPATSCMVLTDVDSRLRGQTQEVVSSSARGRRACRQGRGGLGVPCHGMKLGELVEHLLVAAVLFIGINARRGRE